MNKQFVRPFVVATIVVGLSAASQGEETVPEPAATVGQPADVAPSAYQYRADRPAADNPPESWILLIQYAGLPYDKPLDVNAPAVKKMLGGLLWEEVRPVRRVQLAWSDRTAAIPPPEQLALTYFDSTDQNAHTWWNPLTKREAGEPEVSADGRIYTYAVPVDTWGIVVSVRGEQDASDYTAPLMRAIVPNLWKRMDLEIEWGFDDATAELDYSGRIEAYDGVVGQVRPLAGDSGTTMAGPLRWQSDKPSDVRRGVRMSLLYMGRSAWRRVWPYHAQQEDVARTILTVWTESGSFSFLAADLEKGPILAPEYGFFVRATGPSQSPTEPPRPAPAKTLLGPKMDDILGNRELRGWGVSASPWFAGNTTEEPVTVQGITLPGRSMGMHPGAEQHVAVGWRSPIDGRVNLKANLADGQPGGGDGVEWSIVQETRARRNVLLQGVIDCGGGKAIPPDAEADKLAGVAVARGDVLSLLVGPRGNHMCDSTAIELVITECGGQRRSWNLANDVVDTIHAGNPHADSLGNAEVWSFYTVDARSPAPHQPPFDLSSRATSAGEFIEELAGRGLSTVRRRVRRHSEQTWDQAVRAMRPGEALPPHPEPPFEPAMQLEVPCRRLTAQWKLGAWHLLRHSVVDQDGKRSFNDHPFGVLASETYMILRALDLQGMHEEAAHGLDQWLRLPLQPQVVPGEGGHHAWALPDRPLGLFSDGQGCLTHAEGPPGAGGHMDGVHSMGPGAVAYALTEHFRLTGDLAWLTRAAGRIKANAEWILRQRQVLSNTIPGGESLWSKGLQPAHVVTPDSHCMHMQFYETEAYYWLAVKRLAGLLTLVDPDEGSRLAAEAEAYRKDLVAAIDRSIALTPVVAVRDGTYRSFVPFAPYVRGFASGAWGWRRCQGHVGAIYWDTVQSADPLISPAGLLSPGDVRAQGHLDVLEDRLLLENTKVNARTSGYDPDEHWFSHASWQYQCGLERHANIHLEADDVPNFLRSMLNQYAVDIMPGEYTFREHTTGGPTDKVYEESCFLERLRNMLVMEDGHSLWLARATPRAWLEQGKKIAIRGAPTHFGPVAYEIVSDVDSGRITANVDLPSRNPPHAVFLRFRHPKAAPIRGVTVNGEPSSAFDPEKELVRLEGLNGTVTIRADY